MAGGAESALRVLVNPGEFSTLSRAGRVVVLAHELTHVATASAGVRSNARVPSWLSEGFADHVGYSGSGIAVTTAASELVAAVRSGHAPPVPPGDAAFDVRTGGSPAAYESAWLACRMIAERYGQPTLVRFYRAVQRRGLVSALRGVLDVSQAEFTRSWRAYIGGLSAPTGTP